jgi:hypothetical protein
MSGNSILTNDVISKECLMSLKNNLVFTRSVNREYGKEFAKSGAKIGNTFNIRKPSRYTVTSGAALEVQDSVDQSIALVLDKHYHVGMSFANDDRTLSIDRFKERYIDPAMIALANKIDSAFFADMYKAVYSFEGVPSATALPSTLKGFVNAKARMELLGAPVGQYNAIVDPLVQASLVDGLKGLFQSSDKIAEQYESGLMGIAGGCKFASSANVPKHTIGPLGGTPLTNYPSAYVAGSTSLVTDGWTAAAASRLKAGDVFSIANVNAVNPQTRQSTGQLAQFICTADLSSDGSGNATIVMDRGIYASGQYQNVDALPANNAAITVFGHASSYASVVAPQNLVFNKNAFAIGVADLELPTDGAQASRAVDEDAGLSLTMTSQFDITNYRNVTRIDFLGGWKCIYPELACRVVGQPA